MATKKSKKNSKKKFSFTLLEMVLSIAVLSIIATTICWQIRNMVIEYSFKKGIGIFLTDIKQMKFLALANQVEIEFVLHKSEKEQKYYYRISCTDPNRIIKQPSQNLDHVAKITYIGKGKEHILPTAQNFKIFRSGRIVPEEKLQFYLNPTEKIMIDLISL